MNLKNITKTQLRDFVDAKIRKRRIELDKEIVTAVGNRLDEALTKILGDVSELERVASRFEDLVTDKIHLLGDESVPEYTKTVAKEANKMFNAKKYFLDHIVYEAMRDINNPYSSYNRFKCAPLMDVFQALKEELQPKIKLSRDDLDKLKHELNNAINIEQTGKRAYNALVALGLDMSDLPEGNPNLPAVVKLSVDVCVLNGNCDKQESA